MDQPFTNREISDMFKTVDEKLDRIETQTTNTNGKVADINRWRERANGAAWMAGAFMTLIIIPILGWSLYTLVTINDKIQTSVNQALSAYEINVK